MTFKTSLPTLMTSGTSPSGQRSPPPCLSWHPVPLRRSQASWRWESQRLGVKGEVIPMGTVTPWGTRASVPQVAEVINALQPEAGQRLSLLLNPLRYWPDRGRYVVDYPVYEGSHGRVGVVHYQRKAPGIRRLTLPLKPWAHVIAVAGVPPRYNVAVLERGADQRELGALP